MSIITYTLFFCLWCSSLIIMHKWVIWNFIVQMKCYDSTCKIVYINNESYNISVIFCFSKSYFVIFCRCYKNHLISIQKQCQFSQNCLIFLNFTPQTKLKWIHPNSWNVKDIVGYFTTKQNIVSNYNEPCSKNVICEEE